MLNPTPDVSSRYGAPMGRFTGPDYLEAAAWPIHLQRVRINSGGYDAGGAYWGLGAPLWFAQDQDGNSQFFRASSREAAKAKLRESFPDLRFFR
jgi:hypothetical protein